MKLSLELLEKDKEAGLKLEKLLAGVGFEDGEIFKSEENFKIARKKVLDEHNGRIKEVEDLIQKFNVDTGKK